MMQKIKKTLIRWFALLCVLCISGTAFAETVIIPEGVKTIRQEAFQKTAATSVVIPATTEVIASRAFAESDHLTDVYLPVNTIDIAEDAFDVNPSLKFHVYMGTDNANWALDHGYQVEYITGEIGDPERNAWEKVNTLIATEAVSSKNDDPYYTYRLIAKLTNGSSLPDLDNFNPKAVVRISDDLFVLQFNNDRDTERCANALKSWKSGCVYCEADYFLSHTDSGSGNSSIRSTSVINPDDPMGFTAYTGYIGDSAGNIKIAVIDDGVSSGAVDCTISSDSFDFINNQSGARSYGSSHGTKVATAICESFGKLSDHLTIISYRIENPSNGEISYILMGEALLRAKEAGASFANISIAGESVYDNHQENQFLRECISYFGSSHVIAAAGNHAVSASNYLPGRYCISAGAVQMDASGELVRANGTATGADYSGFATTTSIAAGKVTAALALAQLGTDSIGDALRDVRDGAKMPDLSILAVKYVGEIVLDGGDLPSSILLEVGDPLTIQYAVRPSDATDPTVLAVSGDPSVIAERNHDSRYYRFTAKAAGSTDLTFTSQDGNAQPVVVHVTVRQPVTSVSVTGDTGETLMKGETLPLYAKVLPDNASDKALNWYSSNEQIATVSETGVVTQVGEGSVSIYAVSKSDPDVSSAPVQIVCSNEQRGTGVTVYAEGHVSTVNLKNGAETVQMYATVLPAGANQEVTWSVDRTDIAEINANGLLTAKTPGDVIVTATSVSGKTSGFVGLTVVQLPTAASISGNNSVDVGSTLQLTAAVSPANAKDKTITWSSSDTSVAVVNAAGLVTAKSEGTVVILAACAANPMAVAYFAVNVTVPPVSVTISTSGSTTLDIGGKLALSAIINPTNTSNKAITWSTSDSSVATVSSSGEVTAHAAGTVKITARTVNGKTGTITLNVRQPYTLKFDAAGGTCTTATRTCFSGSAIGSLPAATRDYYTFAGWYTASSGGTQVTATTVFTSASTITVYAHWTIHSLSGWVKPGEVPANGAVAERKWTYTDTVSSTAASLSGYTQTGSYWSQSGSGSVDWVNFSVIPGFKKSNALYTKYNVTAPAASETTSAKRTVSTSRVSYLYWHWMYSSSGANGDRAIFYKEGTGTKTLTGNTYSYKNFGAFESTKNYTKAASGNWGQDDTYYQWYWVDDRTTNAQCQGSGWWYKTPINRTTYTDYTKYYTYTRSAESTTLPSGSNVSNVQEWVKYRLK